jgi:hypothetical protein
MPNPCLLRDWTDSLKVNALDAFAERFFGRLMMKCDDYGRFHESPLLLKSALFPLLTNIRESDISRWAGACQQAGLIRRYVAANGRTYLEVLNFGQRRKWMKSEHPPPEGQIPLLPAETKILATCRSRSRSRSRGEEKSDESSTSDSSHNSHALPPHSVIKKGVNHSSRRECWQLLRDEQQITSRIRQETERPTPDLVLIESLKIQRRQIREEIKTQP